MVDESSRQGRNSKAFDILIEGPYICLSFCIRGRQGATNIDTISKIANTSLVKFCDKDATQKLLIFRSKDVTFAQRSWGEVSSGRLRAFDISKGFDVIILYFTLLL